MGGRRAEGAVRRGRGAGGGAGGRGLGAAGASRSFDLFPKKPGTIGIVRPENLGMI